MRNEVAFGYGRFITSGAHLLLLVAGLRIATRPGWIFCLAAITVISLFVWTVDFRRTRAVADTPTSRVASAPQGYVELFGRAVQHAGRNLVCPASLRPCVWYRYVIEEKRGKDWHRIGSDLSSDTFLLDDGTARVVVDPDGAEIYTTDYRRWYAGGQRYTEWVLSDRDALYALGEFTTEGGAASALDTNADVSALLAEWKKNKSKMLAQFDLNHDGQIDLEEWALARNAARREVAKDHQEIRAQPGVHLIRKPRDGRLFLLSNLSPEQLARRYGLWTHIQLGIAVAASIALLLVSTHMVQR